MLQSKQVAKNLLGDFAESEEFAFWLQIEELNKANVERATAIPQEWDPYTSTEFNMAENVAPLPRQFVNELDQSILKKALAASFRRNVVYPTTVKLISARGVENGDQLQLSVVSVPLANKSNGKINALNRAPTTNAKEGIDHPLRLQEPLLLSVTRECEEPKDSENGVHHEQLLMHPEQFPPSVISCDTLSKLETSSSKNLLELRVDELLMELDALVSSRDRRNTTSDDQRDLTESPKSQSAAAAWRYEQELQLDKAVVEMQSEMLARKHHQQWQDELLARQIETMNVRESFMESNSTVSASSYHENRVYDLFFAEARHDQGYVGVGCAMKDTEGHLVFETRECLGIEISHHFAEYTALTNGLSYARSTGVRRINAYGNRAFIYWEVKGLAEVWTSEKLNLMDALQEQVQGLDSFNLECVSKAENEDAINLAKHAITLYVAEVHKKKGHVRLKGKSRVEEEMRKECLICFEKIFASDMVSQKACDHQFCFNCLSRHVENETLASKVPVRCPQFFACASHMGLYDCQRLVSPKVFDIYTRRLTEATISDSEKVYCPYPNCSAMMCRNVDRKSSRRSRNSSRSSSRSPPGRTPIGGAECMECHRMFGVECQVPWHINLTCQQYQRLPSDERDAEDIKLFQLAKDQNWRRCRQCRRMIILSHGCFHMTCRCGYEFCYTCEAEYQNKKKTCKCPLFPMAARPPRAL